MKSEDLLTALHDEYSIDLTAKGKEDVTTMCNLGEGIYEGAMEKGIERGVEQEKRNPERKDREAALEMIKDGLSSSRLVVSRFFRKFISSASKYRNQIYGFSSSFGCSISILNRCSISI